MSLGRYIFLVILSTSYLFSPQIRAEDISEYSDLVLEDAELNLIEKPTISLEYFYEANHLYYELSGLEALVTFPWTKKLSIVGNIGVFTSLSSKKLLDYYLSQDPTFNVEKFYPKPNSYVELALEYQLLSSRVNFFDIAALPLSFNLQVGGIIEFYSKSVQTYFKNFAGLLRLKSSKSWGVLFKIQASSSSTENRTSYFLGPYWTL